MNRRQSSLSRNRGHTAVATSKFNFGHGSENGRLLRIHGEKETTIVRKMSILINLQSAQDQTWGGNFEEGLLRSRKPYKRSNRRVVPTFHHQCYERRHTGNAVEYRHFERIHHALVERQCL